MTISTYIIILHVDMYKSHVIIIMWACRHTYLACRGQRYATIPITVENQLSTIVNLLTNAVLAYMQKAT